MMESASTKPTTTAGSQRFLAFSLGVEDFAVPLLSVREVVALPEMTRVPNTSGYFSGIMNLRGQIISVFDLRLRFGMKAEHGSETAVIIHNFSQLCFGVVVSSVNNVLSLKDTDISEKPDFQDMQANAYITGVSRYNDKLVLLLDVVKALRLEDIAALKQSAKNKSAA
jgi:purine-binding chemotaxis protein CheW